VLIFERLAAALDAWRAVARARDPGHQSGQPDPGVSMSSGAIFDVVTRPGHGIGLPQLPPHDLPRTWAQLGYEAGIPLTQICKLLGHASVATTQRYLNLDIDLETTIGDFVPFE
jgi:integrase